MRSDFVKQVTDSDSEEILLTNDRPMWDHLFSITFPACVTIIAFLND